MSEIKLHSVYPVTSRFLPEALTCHDYAKLPCILREQEETLEGMPFLVELSEFELHIHHLKENPASVPNHVEKWQVRPGLELLELSWSGLPEFIEGGQVVPWREKCLVLLVPGEEKGYVDIIYPDSNTLLALKIVTENIDLQDLAKKNTASLSLGDLQNILVYAAERKILLRPTSKLIRGDSYEDNSYRYEKYLSVGTFTLQYHITQKCDLHCRHCYDRSQREDVSLDQAIDLFDQLYSFCKINFIDGQISFTGGNPFFHPDFFQLYQEAVDRGFKTTILGNPVPRKDVRRIIELQHPEFYQVSLEGLKSHNDYIRGKGHYDRTLYFLDMLRELGVFSTVMLTLTKANQDQVLPLAEVLREQADCFTFNRLALTGEGAGLVSVEIENYKDFLQSYLLAAEDNPIMRLKDNLFSTLQQENGSLPGGGCTGYGCGAAFNFVSVLSDGQVHACRKFPSLLGNLKCQTFEEVYWSEIAEKYRAGCSVCKRCELRPVCGGCPAVVDGFGKDVFAEVDPYCFKNT